MLRLIIFILLLSFAEVSKAAEFSFDRDGTPLTHEYSDTRDQCIDASAEPSIPTILAGPRGLTVSPNPTLLIYVPKTVKQSLSATVLIKDIDDLEEVFQDSISIPHEGRIISYEVPRGKKELRVGSTYEVTFSIICDPSDRQQDSYTKRFVTRIENSELFNRTQTAASFEDIQYFAEAGAYYELVETAANLLKKNPSSSEYQSLWSQVLGWQDLHPIVTVPFNQE